MKTLRNLAAVLALAAAGSASAVPSVATKSGTHVSDGLSTLNAPSANIMERGVADVIQTRPCREGLLDITGLDPLEKSKVEYLTHGQVCGEIWAGLGFNALTYWGQIDILSHTFSAAAAPAAGAHYIALLTATPANAGVAWGSVSELASSGYARVQVVSWTCTTSTSANNSCATGSRSWTNSSGSAWTGVTAMAVVDAASGAPSTYGYKAYVALSTTRTLQNGDSLTINPFTLTLQ